MEDSFQQGRQQPVVFKGSDTRGDTHFSVLTIGLSLATVLGFKTFLFYSLFQGSPYILQYIFPLYMCAIY